MAIITGISPTHPCKESGNGSLFLGVLDLVHAVIAILMFLGKKDKEIQWKKGNHKVTVHFIPDAWHDKMDVLVADGIQYGLPYTKENVKMLKDAAVQKYGIPSSDSIGKVRWCTSTDGWDTCRDGKEAELYLYYDYTVGILHLSLDDIRYFNALREAINKTKTEKPKI